jgi:hypothetical protein
MALSLGLALALTPAASKAAYEIFEMQAWATSVEEVVRGPMDIADPGLGNASWGEESYVLGEAANDVFLTLSLGDGGSITLGLETGIGDGPGDDFAVFENGIWSEEGFFAELAFVEVSSNGVDFARFAAESNQSTPVPGGGIVDPANYYNLAGVDPVGTGTGFDLVELTNHPLALSGDLDLQDVGFVRLVDVIGDGSTFDADSMPVYDPYATPFQTGGFDLNGVGVLNVPEPATTLLLALGLLVLALLTRLRERGVRPSFSPRGVGGAMLAASLAIVGPLSTAHATQIVTFEDLDLDPQSHWNGEDESGGFVSEGVAFENAYFPDPDFPYWYGFGYSNVVDITTPGLANQFAAFPGSGVGGSESYGLFFDDSFNDPHMVLPTADVVSGLYLTNTTYAYLSMLNGDAFAKKFGGADGTDEDWFLLTIHGYDESGGLANSFDFYLADFRSANSVDDYIIDSWTWVDLTALGEVKSLGFEMSSSDVSFGFMNTPGYFALDDFTVVPEPATGLLVALGLVGLAARRRR